MPKPTTIKVVVAYVPVIHRGYIRLFEKFRGYSVLYILAEAIIKHEDYLRKELRAVTPQQAVTLISSLKIFSEVKLLNMSDLKQLNRSNVEVVLPDEDISHHIAENYLDNASVKFYPIFLRWDRKNVEGAREEEKLDVTTKRASDIQIMKQAFELSRHSPDIWRHVGAILVKNGKILWSVYNEPLSTPNTPWAEGDPRSLFKRGVEINMSTFMHAEANVIATAAQSGVSLAGAWMYVTNFPCPACAMLIAKSGIKKCYYVEGYAILDGRRIMQEAGVEVVRVEMDIPRDIDSVVDYPTKPI